MNYNYLRYFSVLAEVEHYTVAAARLGISQPALSSAIHSLENELGGVRLFEKVGRNIRLTEEGRFYKEKVDQAINGLYSATRLLRDSRTSAPVVIRVGVVSGTLQGLLARRMVEYTRQNQRVRFDVTEGSAESLMDLVRQEKLEMAIVDSANRDRSLHFRKLTQRDFYVALPMGHPLAERGSLEHQEVVREPQVVFHSDAGESFKEWSTGSAGEERSVCTVNTSRAALELVAAGMGIAVIPDSCLEDYQGIQYVPLRNWHQALYMCTLYDKLLEPLIWDFVEQIVKAFRGVY